uniref:Uncharacterized protein n=1 Tax=Arion vulgaris TaxID=1028688 RepID=A0A0B7BCI1_9EUPU
MPSIASNNDGFRLVLFHQLYVCKSVVYNFVTIAWGQFKFRTNEHLMASFVSFNT